MKNATSIAVGLALVTGCGAVSDETIGGTARVRVAHLSPDAPAIDFCLVASSGEVQGPVLGGAGGLAGLAYGRVSRYFDVAAGAYDVRLVAPGAADCGRGLLPDITGLPALPEDGAVTLAALGTLAHDPAGGTPFELRAYADATEVGAGEAKLRFVHASPGTPAVDVGLGGGVVFQPVFEAVPYGGVTAHEDGYVTTAPFADAEVSVRATGSATDVLGVPAVKLPEGALATVFAIGTLGSEATPLRALACTDNAPPHAIETECAIVGGAPERARVRIAHLSPDAPAVDVCLARTGEAFTEPLLGSLGQRAGLGYAQLSGYVELPLGSYDVRVIAATETSCDRGAVPDTTGLVVTPGLTATVAAIGVLDRSGAALGDPGFRLAVYADAVAVAPGKAKLRFVHASPGTPNVDVGLGAGAGFTRLYANVEFGAVALHGAVDAIGYLETAPLTATISARLANATTDALTIHGVTLAAGEIATAFAIGNKTGSPQNPLRVLLCADHASSTSVLASCLLAP